MVSLSVGKKAALWALIQVVQTDVKTVAWMEQMMVFLSVAMKVSY